MHTPVNVTRTLPEESELSFTVCSRIGMDNEGKPFQLLVSSIKCGNSVLETITYEIQDGKIKRIKFWRL